MNEEDKSAPFIPSPGSPAEVVVVVVVDTLHLVRERQARKWHCPLHHSTHPQFRSASSQEYGIASKQSSGAGSAAAALSKLTKQKVK